MVVVVVAEVMSSSSMVAEVMSSSSMVAEVTEG
jgi:hypothetical protein